MWEKPHKLEKGQVIKLPRQGNSKECEYWGGIALLPVASKVMGCIIIDQIRIGIDYKLRKEEAGFRKGSRMTEQAFVIVLQNVIEQINKWEAALYLNFSDFEKAFDITHRESLCKMLTFRGVLQKLVNIAKIM